MATPRVDHATRRGRPWIAPTAPLGGFWGVVRRAGAYWNGVIFARPLRALGTSESDSIGVPEVAHIDHTLFALCVCDSASRTSLWRETNH